MTSPGDLKLKRHQAVHCIEALIDQLRSAAADIRYYDDSDADVEWPLSHHIPEDVWDAIRAVCSAASALGYATTKAKQNYRRLVLVWLLAELDFEQKTKLT